MIIADDPDHEKCYAEIYRNRKFFALISQEDGPDRLIVELPGIDLYENQVTRQVPLGDFITMLEQAARRLIDGAEWHAASEHS